jgi:putative transposase
MSDHPNRKLNRLPGYDYSRAGYYYVTICAGEKGNTFGQINNGAMELNPYGDIALKYYQSIPLHYQNVIIESAIGPGSFNIEFEIDRDLDFRVLPIPVDFLPYLWERGPGQFSQT